MLGQKSWGIAVLNNKTKNLMVKEIWHFENVKIILQILDMKLSRPVCLSSFVTEEVVKPNNF